MMVPGQDGLSGGEQQKAKRLIDGLDATMERMRKNPVRLVCWFVLLVWFGVSLLLMALGTIGAKITPEPGGDISAAQRGWALFAWGGGTIALFETLLRLIVSRWRDSVAYSFIRAVVWIAVGFSLWYDSWDTLGPIGIIGLGLVLAATAALWQKKGLAKSLEERIKRIKENPVRFATVAALVIWFGVSLLLMALDTISGKVATETTEAISASERGWAVFALGGAALFFLETLVRLIVQRWRHPALYSFIWGLLWMAVGLSLWFNNWKTLAPIVFIGLGVVLMGLLLPRPEK